jgi:hypothetical protein
MVNLSSNSRHRSSISGASMLEAIVLLAVVALGAVAGVASFGHTVQDAACKPIAIVQTLDPGRPADQIQELLPTQWSAEMNCCTFTQPPDGWGSPTTSCVENTMTATP